MKRIDFNNLGGNPIDQQSFEFMQDSYLSQLAAIAKLCGDKTILTGVVVTSGTVSGGWISYNGELVRFVGGAVDTAVLVAEAPTYNAVFENTITHDEEFEKTAICTSTGTFPFSDLKRLGDWQSLTNTTGATIVNGVINTLVRKFVLHPKTVTLHFSCTANITGSSVPLQMSIPLPLKGLANQIENGFFTLQAGGLIKNLFFSRNAANDSEMLIQDMSYTYYGPVTVQGSITYELA